MTQDEIQDLLENEVPEPTPEPEPTPDPEPEPTPEPEVDYRGKLNATNSFLKKEGYTFNEQTNKWVPPVRSVTPEVPTDSKMSIADATAILKADVHEDDIERVEKFAADEKISIKDALKNDEMKAILAIRAEKRSTANAANISNVRRGPTKVTDDVLLANADAGKLPDDDEGIERLVAAKAKRK